MCILRFHSRAGYLQHYKTLLKELNAHPASDPVPPDQYEVERAALSDHNLNVPCKSGICYPSMLVMLHRRQTQSKILIMLYIHVYTMYILVCTMYIHVCTCLYKYTCLAIVHTCMYMYINLTCCAWQANTHSSTGCVRLDINLPAPLRS